MPAIESYFSSVATVSDLPIIGSHPRPPERIGFKHDRDILLCALLLQDIDVLDIFAGAGGLSFLAQDEPGVAIRAKWAVDINASAVETYRANHPEAHVSSGRINCLALLVTCCLAVMVTLFCAGWLGTSVFTCYPLVFATMDCEVILLKSHV
jgi:hypothetical protein